MDIELIICLIIVTGFNLAGNLLIWKYIERNEETKDKKILSEC